MLQELRILRKSAKITQSEMARRLKISKQLYSQLEREDVRLSYERAIQIAKIFNTTPDKIFLSDMSIENRPEPTGTDDVI